jgi:hypothetical protein
MTFSIEDLHVVRLGTCIAPEAGRFEKEYAVYRYYKSIREFSGLR